MVALTHSRIDAIVPMPPAFGDQTVAVRVAVSGCGRSGAVAASTSPRTSQRRTFLVDGQSRGLAISCPGGVWVWRHNDIL